MSDVEDEETFRAGVGIVVEGADRTVLALERRDVVGAWQLPQGGLLRGEDAEGGARRELREEVGLTAGHVTLVASTQLWFGYELPRQYQSPKTGRGQVHQWFLFRLRPGAALPPLPTDAAAEFRSRRWITMSALVGAVVAFRRAEYDAVMRWLESVGVS